MKELRIGNYVLLRLEVILETIKRIPIKFGKGDEVIRHRAFHSVSYQPKAIPVLYETQMEHTIFRKHYTVGVQTPPNNCRAFDQFSLSGEPYGLREKPAPSNFLHSHSPNHLSLS